ncbi:MAG: trypsin-like peptidase domain-containing protein [Chromatiales bacterium]|nr:trypsin-like peptidase domain-containing protein [Gammaproteobacteria bacterium]MBW6476233.1 trypsin-like peptidase domain-containing protein [Chromatiales bacterium]
MRLHKPVVFLFQAVTIGLALAFLILLWQPELLNNGKRVVEFIEGSGSTLPRQSGPASYADAVALAAPAVVNIHSRKIVVQSSPLFDDPFFRHFFGDRFQPGPQHREETSLGSGVIVSPQGYILTNHHVIADAEEIRVSLHDGRTAAASVVGRDSEADLAVLKIKLDALPVITLGDSEAMRVGDVVLAIGNPFGVGQTVTLGIISATGRSELGISTFENFIQTDAAINPGNSGGALITAYGELIGINTAIFSRSGGSQGIGFAIPVSLARSSMAQIIERGHVSRGWLGVEIQELTPQLAESFAIDSQAGIVVAGVLRGGPADKAGLEPGDVITHIDAQAVVNAHTALRSITQTQPGQSIRIRGLRAGEHFERQAIVAERPQP